MNFIYKNVNLIKYDIPKKISTESFTYNSKTKKFVSDRVISASKKGDKSTLSKSSKSNNNESLGKCPICQGEVLEKIRDFSV